MKEFMLLVRTEGDHLTEMSPKEQQAHVNKIAKYIGNLMQEGKLKSAQPLDMECAMISGNKGVFKDGPFIESKELIVGYFHILANNLEEAITIAKANPVFEAGEASIEVRPIKTMDGIN